MIESWFNALTFALESNLAISVIAATGWGILSIILSPCHLSSIPLIIGYNTSRSSQSPRQSFLLSLVFSLGILVTIATIGIMTALAGKILGDIGVIGNYVVALVFFVVGLYLMDIITIPWSGFGVSKSKHSGIAGALILGLLFGVGLGPCTFAYMAPVLGIVFQTSQTDPLRGILLILAFGTGHCAVITFAGSLSSVIQRYLNWTEQSRATLWIKRSAGFLVLLGGFYFIYLTVC